ncbi:family 16 glycoside hydrolase [Stieleria varia]|uniref:Cytochrome c n=1 Tax=Stieleria varia TaxID=2528005 RepID=A0A5C6B8M8_9BACT|nr:family 16 glycoside hydrolase [Stieleria varia]TWU08443.1 Cytochrome c [Stieleria varia]
MRTFLILLCSLACTLSGQPITHAEDPAFQILFDGKTLNGWKGNEGLWSVQDGAIVGETTAENPTNGNTFLVWQGGDVGDFEFRCLVRFQGNNSGVQYRSSVVDPNPYVLKGYQADLHPKQDYIGMMYGEKTGRGIIATRGQRITVGADGKTTVDAKLVADETIVGEQWNELRIIAVGNRLIHQVNGVTTVDITDNHPDAAATGLLGLQLHAGPPMKCEFRGLLLRSLDAEAGKQLIATTVAATKTQSDKAADQANVGDTIQGSGWITADPKPNWIWVKQSTDGQRIWFRHEFDIDGEIKAAAIYATCDNKINVTINGKPAGKSNRWEAPVQTAVSELLKPGRNVIAIAGENEGGVAALVAKLQIQLASGKTQTVITDANWLTIETKPADWDAPQADTTAWAKAIPNGKLGKQPWGVPAVGGAAAGDSDRLNPRNVYAPPGFVVERVHVVTGDQGSWVSLATDPQGRLYACDQAGAGLYRLTIADDGSAEVEKVSVGELSSISGIQGMVWANDGLWVHRNGGNLHHLTDTDGDGNLDHQVTYPGTTGGGEHGNHAVIVTEDGEALYLDGGNHAPLAQHERSRVPTWSEGLLLPRMWDARGHARGKLAPGGWVTRLDPETKKQTVYTIGFRNQYDIALNRFGDLFTYDADMEWDLGLPWYRPTRICFVNSGGDYGWRSGSGKWPTYYEDSLPPVVEIGPGSPTGVSSGAGAHFPTRYQDGLFALDWTFGTIYSIKLIPDGAGYRGEAEAFVYGSPLPVTDSVVGHDGCLYFAVGGRGSASALYRVRYLGDDSCDAPQDVDAVADGARAMRRDLEAFHGVSDPRALDKAWPLLSSNDRFLRHAARVAVESQPVDSWANRVPTESDPQSRVTATVALARMGTADHQAEAVKGLLSLDAKSLRRETLLGMLRAYALLFSELESPTLDQRKAVVAQLDPLLPSDDRDVNVELVRLLTYLRSPTVVAKTLALIQDRTPMPHPAWAEIASRNSGYGAAIQNVLDSNPPTAEIMYAFILRNLRTGWTIPQRRAYFEFLNEAAKASGGASYSGYLTRIRDEALGNCTDAERLALQYITGEDFNPKPDFPIADPVGPGQKWTTQAVLGAMRGKPDFERGRSLFFSAKCASCHRMTGLGGNIGPDLTSVRNKFDRDYVAQAIVEPSKDISDQYGSSSVLTVGGQVHTGLVVEQPNGDLLVYPVDENAKSITIAADDVELVKPSKVSQMPAELLDRLNAGEVRDLIEYVMAAGDPNDKRYQDK